jgi:hypothetical protein
VGVLISLLSLIFLCLFPLLRFVPPCLAVTI